MSTMNQGPAQQYRGIAEQLARRAEQDEAFAEQARADPVGTLVAAGIPADAASQLLQSGDEVAGYVPRNPDCGDTTCWISACPECCNITISC